MSRPTQQERDLKAQIGDLVDIHAAALKAKDFRNARDTVTALGKARADLERRRRVRLAHDIQCPIEQQRELQRICEADGSWTASTKIATEVRRLEEEAAASGEEEAKPEDMSPEELLAQAEEAASTYPMSLCVPFVQRYLELVGMTREQFGWLVTQIPGHDELTK